MDQALSSTTRAKDCLAGAGLLLSPNQNADQISGRPPRGGVSYSLGPFCECPLLAYSGHRLACALHMSAFDLVLCENGKNLRGAENYFLRLNKNEHAHEFLPQ